MKAGAIYIAATSVFGAMGSCSWKIALHLNNSVSRWESGAPAIGKTQNISAITPDMTKGIISDFIKSFVYPNNSPAYISSEDLPFPEGTLYTDDVAVIQLGISQPASFRYGYYYVPYKLFEAEDLKDAENIASHYSLTGYVLVSENGESMTYISCQ